MRILSERISLRIRSFPEKYYTVAFWILTGISMSQFLFFRYAPSLDGPQHLYNAYVLRDLLLDRGDMREFFALNPLPVGYWTAHLLLSVFTLVFPPWLAEKMLLLICVFGIAFSYRYFLGSMDREVDPMAQFLIFPMIPSFFLLAGYYSFSYGIICFLLTYGYWNRAGRDFRWSAAWKFSLLLLLLYFTSGLVFSIFLVTFMLTVAYEFLAGLHRNREIGGYLRQQGIRALRLIVAFAPALLLLYLYTRSVRTIQSGPAGIPSDTMELIRQLIRIRPLIGFHHQKESVATLPLFFMLVMTTIAILIGKVRGIKQTGPGKILRDSRNIWLLLSIFFLVIYLLNPDRFMSGSMTTRIGFFFFLLLIMWIPAHRIPSQVSLIMGVVILFAVVYKQALMPRFYRPQVALIKELQELDSYMEKGGTVLALREFDNWVNLHFSLYIGLTGSHVNFSNPQCYGPFPQIWNPDLSKAVFAGDLQIDPSGSGGLDPATHEHLQVDYITLFYQDRFLNNPENTEWVEMLNQDYEIIHITSRGAGALYRKRAGGEGT